MKRNEFFGYLLGFVLFVIALPLGMWLLAGRPAFAGLGLGFFAVMGAAGLALSVWAIVYMRRVGRGNPMDAFDHELAPRTSVLMTEGPYKLCRNPMLLGVIVYYFGLLIFLRSGIADLVFLAFFLVMMIQVDGEEKRLERDFGQAYLAYKAETKKLIPFLW